MFQNFEIIICHVYNQKINIFHLKKKDKESSKPWQSAVHFDVESLSHVLQRKPLSSLAFFMKQKPECWVRDKPKTGYSETWSRNCYHIGDEAPGVLYKKHWWMVTIVCHFLQWALQLYIQFIITSYSHLDLCCYLLYGQCLEECPGEVRNKYLENEWCAPLRDPGQKGSLQICWRCLGESFPRWVLPTVPQLWDSHWWQWNRWKGVPGVEAMLLSHASRKTN